MRPREPTSLVGKAGLCFRFDSRKVRRRRLLRELGHLANKRAHARALNAFVDLADAIVFDCDTTQRFSKLAGPQTWFQFTGATKAPQAFEQILIGVVPV